MKLTAGHRFYFALLTGVTMFAPKEKTPDTCVSGVRIKAWQCPTFTWGGPTLSSALSSFTSEFGMGSGGTHLPLPPGKLVMFSS